MVLAYPFRLFFLAGGVYAVVSMAGWLGFLAGHVGRVGPGAGMLWHGHEMVFGYTLAVVAGFILTAVSNWTGSAPWKGRPLAALGLLWLAGRLAFTFAPWLPSALVASVDLAFLPALTYMLAVPLVAAGNRRQFIILGVLAALFFADLAVHMEISGLWLGGGHLGVVVGVDLLIMLITMLGGRIIPAFTGNALRARGITALPVTRDWLERAALLSLVAVVVLDTVAELSPLAGVAALAAAALHGFRLAGWQGHRVLRQPILWVLHLGYGWLVLGLALKGLAVLSPALPTAAALHALTVGAVGTLTIGIMSRVALGHTGRPLTVAPITIAAYLVITAAAVVRVVVPAALPGLTEPAMTVSGMLWIAAFILFLIGHAGILTKPRADGRPG